MFSGNVSNDDGFILMSVDCLIYKKLPDPIIVGMRREQLHVSTHMYSSLNVQSKSIENTMKKGESV